MMGEDLPPSESNFVLPSFIPLEGKPYLYWGPETPAPGNLTAGYIDCRSPAYKQACDALQAGINAALREPLPTDQSNPCDLSGDYRARMIQFCQSPEYARGEFSRNKFCDCPWANPSAGFAGPDLRSGERTNNCDAEPCTTSPSNFMLSQPDFFSNFVSPPPADDAEQLAQISSGSPAAFTVIPGSDPLYNTYRLQRTVSPSMAIAAEPAPFPWWLLIGAALIYSQSKRRR